jgi:hypothetical protein
MEYLLSHTMKTIEGSSDLTPIEAVIEELKKFPEACRLQIFQSGSDEVAAFTVKRYQNDLELFLNDKGFLNFKSGMQVQNALYWLYTNYPEYCDQTHEAPAFFVEQIIEEAKSRYGNDPSYILKAQALQEEIEFLKTQPRSLQNLFALRQTGFVEHWIVPDDLKEKLKIGITVAQLGVLLNLLYEQDFFTGATKIAVIKFFASHFATEKQAHISYESLYGKFFKMELNDLDAVKEKLIQMINSINKKTNAN